MENRFTLTFVEAMDECFNKKHFIQGEHFAKGIYAKCDDGIIVLCKSRDLSFTKENILLTKGLYTQKFRLITASIEAENIY